MKTAKRIATIIALVAALYSLWAHNQKASAWWQSVAQQSVGAAPAAYQGPGDVFTTAYLWGSCARVYNASAASTSTALCDLVANAAPTVVICTLRGTASGFVDLTLCADGVTVPTTVCGALPATVCNISQIYDQTGNSRHWTQTTAAAQPTLTFGAINGLPAITFTPNQVVATSAGGTTLIQPFTMSAVYKRTSGTTLSGLISNGGAQVGLFASATGGQAALLATTEVDAAASENNWHGFQGLASGSGNNCATNLDSADTASLNCGTTIISGGNLRVGRSSASVTITGQIAEIGAWAKTSTPTDRGNVYSNQHGVNGYNGAF